MATEQPRGTGKDGASQSRDRPNNGAPETDWTGAVESPWLYTGSDYSGSDTGPDWEAGEGRDGSAGWQDLKDIEDTPPAPALVGFVASEAGDLTVVYAAGGVGKGTFAAYLAVRVIEGGGRVAIIDAEGHPKEWRRRISDMKRTPLEAGQVALRGYEGGPLDLPDMADMADLIIIDSAGYIDAEAGSHDEWLSVAKSLQRECVRAGVPCLVIAHVSKAQPGQAYGSVGWRNVPRLQWSLDREYVTCQKVNDVAGIEVGDRWAITFEKDDMGRITTYALEEAPHDVPMATKVEQFREWLEEGRSLAEAMEWLDGSEATAKRWLHKHGVNVNPVGMAGKWKPA